jgi:hypothetical protein
MDEPIKNEEQSLKDIADKGAAIYETIKDKFEPDQKGKFLAIEVEHGNYYVGETSREAIEQARAANPGKRFYLVKIGFSATETLMASFVGRNA